LKLLGFHLLNGYVEKIVSQSGNKNRFMAFPKSPKCSKRKNNFITPFSFSVREGNRVCGSIK
jgi:hypothetical protein